MSSDRAIDWSLRWMKGRGTAGVDSIKGLVEYNIFFFSWPIETVSYPKCARVELHENSAAVMMSDILLFLSIKKKWDLHLQGCSWRQSKDRHVVARSCYDDTIRRGAVTHPYCTNCHYHLSVWDMSVASLWSRDTHHLPLSTRCHRKFD